MGSGKPETRHSELPSAPIATAVSSSPSLPATGASPGAPGPRVAADESVPVEAVDEATPPLMRRFAQPARRFVSLAGMGLVFPTSDGGPPSGRSSPASRQGSPSPSRSSSASSGVDPPSPQSKILRAGPQEDEDYEDLGGFGWAPRRWGPAIDSSPSRTRRRSSVVSSAASSRDTSPTASPTSMRRAISCPGPPPMAAYNPLDASPARRLFIPTAIDPYSVPPSSLNMLPSRNDTSALEAELATSLPASHASGDFEAWLSDTDSLRSGSSSNSLTRPMYPPLVPSTRPSAPTPSHAAGNMVVEHRGLNDEREESEWEREERLIRARGMQKSRSADGPQMLVRLMERRELARTESTGVLREPPNNPLSSLLPLFRPSHFEHDDERPRGRSPTRAREGPPGEFELTVSRTATDTPTDSTLGGTPEPALGEASPDAIAKLKTRELPTGMLGPSPSPTPPISNISDKDSDRTSAEEVEIAEIDVPLSPRVSVPTVGPAPAAKVVHSPAAQEDAHTHQQPIRSAIQPKPISLAGSASFASAITPKTISLSPAAPRPVLVTAIQPKALTFSGPSSTKQNEVDDPDATKELFRILAKKKPVPKIPSKAVETKPPSSPQREEPVIQGPLPPVSPAPRASATRVRQSDSFSLTSDSEADDSDDSSSVDDPRGGKHIGSPFSAPTSDTTSDTQDSDDDQGSPSLGRRKWIGVSIGTSPNHAAGSSTLHGLDLGNTGTRLPAANGSKSTQSNGLKRVASSKRLSDERFKDVHGGVIGSPREKSDHFLGAVGVSSSGDVAGARHRRGSVDERDSRVGGRVTSAGSSSSGSSRSSEASESEEGSVFEEEVSTYDVNLSGSQRYLPHSVSAPSLLEQRRGLLNLTSPHPNAGLFDHLPTLRSGKLVRPALRSSRHSSHYKKSLRFSDTSLKSVVLFEKHDVPYAVIAAPRYTAPDSDSLPAGFVRAKFRYDLIMRSEHVPEHGELTMPEHMVVLRSLRRMDEGIMFGEVHVRNLSFNKRVSVHYTLDFWQSHEDLTCHYLSPLESSYGIDRFGFHLDIGETFRRIYDRDKEASAKLVRLTMIFAVRYVAEDCGEWWDNNWGMNYEVELTRAPDILGSGVGVPGIEPTSTAPGPMTSRGPPSALFSSNTWLQPGTIMPLWLTQPGGVMDSPRDSPNKSFWPTPGFGTGPLWGPNTGLGNSTQDSVDGTANASIGDNCEPKASSEADSKSKKGPVYTSIFFDTSLLPHNEAVAATSPTMDPVYVDSYSHRSPSGAAPSAFFADFTFETRLPPSDKSSWLGTYSSAPASSSNLGDLVDLDALMQAAGSTSTASGAPAPTTSTSSGRRSPGSPSKGRRTSFASSSNVGSPSNALLESLYIQKMREQGSWTEDSSGDWANSRRRNLFSVNEEKDGQRKSFRTEVVDVGEYTRTGGRSAMLAGRKP